MVEKNPKEYVSFKKVIIFGDHSTGKTTFTNKILDIEFDPLYKETEKNLEPRRIGGYKLKSGKELNIDTIEVDTSRTGIGLLDTNQLENIIFECNCALFFIDLTSPESLGCLKLLDKKLSEIPDTSFLTRIIVANKIDRKEDIVIKEEELNQFIDKKYLKFNISLKEENEGFELLLQKIYDILSESKSQFSLNYISELLNKKAQISTGNNITLILLGDTSVGKSSFLNRSCKYVFNENFLSTIGMDKETKFLKIGEDPVKLTMWDTAGQERFRALPDKYYQNADGILLLFDVTNLETFDNAISSWIKDISKNAKRPISNEKDGLPVYLVGNKIDLSNRKVSKQTAESSALKKGMKYFECSCKANLNVFEILGKLVMDCYSKSPTSKESILLTKERTNSNRHSQCCNSNKNH